MGIINTIGEGAGRIWKELNAEGSQNQNRLMKRTELPEKYFYASIGWLARENKISQYGMYYKLSETNLNEKISTNVEKLINVLKDFNEIDEHYLPKLTGLSEEEIYTALGWLAREGKLSVSMELPLEPLIKYHLCEEESH
jgi:hypothetical protein